MRRGEPGPRPLLHGAAAPARGRLSLVRRREPARREVLHGVRHAARRRRGRARRRRPARPAARRRPRSAARRPILFADLSGYTAVAERLDPEAVKTMVDRALRRLGDEVEPLRRDDRQVHRRQRHGRLRRAGRPRGRPRAGGPRGPGDAGGDGGDQRARSRGPWTPASRCGSASTPARCSPARSAVRLHGDRRRGQRRRPPAGGRRPGSRHRRRAHLAPDPRARSSTASSSRSTLKGKSEPVPAWEAERVIVSGPPRGARRESAPLVGPRRRVRPARLAPATASSARSARTWSR